VDNAWKDAYKAGVFTEFQEQRAPGHTVLDDKIYKRGFLDFKKTIEKQIESLDFMADPKTLDKREELRSMAVTADAIMTFAERHAQKLQQLADNESDPDRKHELRQMQNICRRVPHHAPQTFWEALQYYWFIHLGVITELNTWDSFNPGGWINTFGPSINEKLLLERSPNRAPANYSRLSGLNSTTSQLHPKSASLPKKVPLIPISVSSIWGA